MKKKHLLLLLGSLLLGGLIGMFGATFTNLHLNISQEQVQFILTTIFFCLGILSTIVALYFIMNSRKVYAYLETYDEGEKQAEMEEAYLILFKLNQLILPSVYIILFALSIILGEVQLVAALITAVIHLYINIAQLRKTKRYFK